MKAPLVVASVLGLLVCAADAAATFKPSFYPENCSWNATHIIVVSEGDKIDGDVEVLESWKGDLKRGDRITVPELAAFAPEEERAISKRVFLQDEEKGLPRLVTCSRMVLFLVRKQEQPKGDKPAKWLPAADWGGMTVSTAWVETDTVFAFSQAKNPGPSRLHTYRMNECRLKCWVDEVVTAQNTLTEALRQNDAVKLSAAVSPLLRSKSHVVRIEVIRTLGTSGAKSLPSLRGIFEDEALLAYHDDAIRAFTTAGGAAVGPELIDILKQERAFWAKVGPGLPKGWLNEGKIDSDEVERLIDRANRACAAIDGLAEFRHAGSREKIIEFRDYLRSLPQLAEIDRLDEACETALEKLNRK